MIYSDRHKTISLASSCRLTLCNAMNTNYQQLRIAMMNFQNFKEKSLSGPQFWLWRLEPNEKMLYYMNCEEENDPTTLVDVNGSTMQKRWFSRCVYLLLESGSL